MEKKKNQCAVVHIGVAIISPGTQERLDSTQRSVQGFLCVCGVFLTLYESLEANSGRLTWERLQQPQE